jgi:hypothetical protein
VTHPTWIDAWRDIGIARSQFAEAAEKLASLQSDDTVPPGFRADREAMVGLLLHNGYGAVEQALERLISAYDGGLPQGSNHHRDLLARAAREVQGQRPAMIAKQTHKLLDDLR